MSRSVQETIEYLNLIISQHREQGKNKFGLEMDIVNDSNNVIDYITNYYNLQGISCAMKYCVLKNDYEVMIWW